MGRDRLPTVPAPAPDAGCPDCTRRLALQALGATAAASLLGLGCTGDEMPPDDGPPAGTIMCDANLCVLLDDPANAPLLSPNGARVLSVAGAPLLIVRRDGDVFVVLSARCTHSGCTVAYAPSRLAAECPCHGSQFTLTGAVAQGPASSPLRRYDATFDAAAQTLTIVL